MLIQDKGSICIRYWRSNLHSNSNKIFCGMIKLPLGKNLDGKCHTVMIWYLSSRSHIKYVLLYTLDWILNIHICSLHFQFCRICESFWSNKKSIFQNFDYQIGLNQSSKVTFKIKFKISYLDLHLGQSSNRNLNLIKLDPRG